jgi:hypothetical protein
VQKQRVTGSKKNLLDKPIVQHPATLGTRYRRICSSEGRVRAPSVTLSDGDDDKLHQSSAAYDKRVAGVISGTEEHKPGVILNRQQSSNKRVPLALSGKVYCKVDARYSAVNVGDLLTTSPKLL